MAREVRGGDRSEIRSTPPLKPPLFIKVNKDRVDVYVCKYNANNMHK